MARIPTGIVDKRTAGGEHCLAVDELSAFSTGRLPEPETHAIFRHLTSCQSCSERLDKLPSADAISSLLRNCQAAIPILDEPECARLQTALQALPARAREAARQAKEATVSSRLAADDSEPSPVVAKPNAPTVDETISCSPPLPSRIRRYEIQRLLGQGSFGRVFLAFDPDLHRQVALKVPRVGLVFRQPLIDAFLQEARTAARLNHPGIVTIYEVGYDRDFGCFIAMEYVAGKSLKQLQSAGRLSPAEAANYMAQAAEAVHYAHKQKLVHRDIKPANLLVNAEGRLKVADFGLALFDEEQRERAGEFAGTLAYISPEQLRGETQHLDGRTDVYSLGVVLYELLTGKRPFTGSTDDVSDDVLNRLPKPLRQIDDTISPELERICLKCLAKDAANRFPTAKDLAHDLTAAMNPAAPGFAPFKVTSRSSKAALVIAALLLLAALIGSPWIYGALQGDPDSASVNLTPQLAEPPLPYDMDTLPRLKTVQLWKGSPREFFPPDNKEDYWRLEPDNALLRIDTPSALMVGLGTTQATSFTLRAEISKSALASQGGLIVGFRPHPTEALRWGFEAVVVKIPRPDRCYVVRTVYDIKEYKGGAIAFSGYDVAAVDVPLGAIERAALEIRVESTGIQEIRWRGEPLSKLTEESPPNVARDCRGEFGAISFSSSTIFHEPRFERAR